jgi:hypothetical protein
LLSASLPLIEENNICFLQSYLQLDAGETTSTAIMRADVNKEITIIDVTILTSFRSVGCFNSALRNSHISLDCHNAMNAEYGWSHFKPYCPRKCQVHEVNAARTNSLKDKKKTLPYLVRLSLFFISWNFCKMILNGLLSLYQVSYKCYFVVIPCTIAIKHRQTSIFKVFSLVFIACSKKLCSSDSSDQLMHHIHASTVDTSPYFGILPG